MMETVVRRHSCRLCSSSDVELIYEMPACPPVDNFREPGSPEISLPKFPMDLYMCSSCGHAQLLDVVDPQLLYGNYIYTSGSSTDLDRHFSQYVSQVVAYLRLSPGAKILDIGSNDGLLLSKFKDAGFRVHGIDPSSYVASKAAERGIETLVSFLNRDSVTTLIAKFGAFDVVTANNVFSHADNLREFAVCVHDLLADNGAFVFEVSYLMDLVENMVIDYVYHEHLCHHSVKPLQRFLDSCGLRLIHIERINTKGGSIRCYAVKNAGVRSAQPIVASMIQDEIDFGLYDLSTYKALENKIEAIANKLRGKLAEVIRSGGVVASYGASATSTVLNELLGMNKFLSFIIDDNPLRQNRLSPGYLLPVISSKALHDFRPDCVVISAWRFAEDIVRCNQTYLANGGHFIVPLPELKEIYA